VPGNDRAAPPGNGGLQCTSLSVSSLMKPKPILPRIPAVIARHFHVIPKKTASGTASIAVVASVVRDLDNVYMGCLTLSGNTPRKMLAEMTAIERNCKIPPRIDPSKGEFMLHGVPLRPLDTLPNGIRIVEIIGGHAYAAVSKSAFIARADQHPIGFITIRVGIKRHGCRYTTTKGALRALRKITAGL